MKYKKRKKGREESFTDSDTIYPLYMGLDDTTDRSLRFFCVWLDRVSLSAADIRSVGVSIIGMEAEACFLFVGEPRAVLIAVRRFKS